jgi:hypothetical protein
MADVAVEVDVSKRCVHNCFTIQLGSPSQWHFPGAGTRSAVRNLRWVFHLAENCECPCFSAKV